MKEGIKPEVVQTGLHEFVVNPSLSHDVPDKSERVVNLLEMTCTCGVFQHECFPCLHAAAAIIRCGADLFNFIDARYTVQKLKDA